MVKKQSFRVVDEWVFKPTNNPSRGFAELVTAAPPHAGMHARGGRLSFVLGMLLLACCLAQYAHGEEAESAAYSNACFESLRSNCNAEQDQLLKELLLDLEMYGEEGSKAYMPGGTYGDAPALGVLPKDRFGMVNWNKAVIDGIINPKGNLMGVPEKPYEGFLENIIFYQAKVFLMADVAFPHGMHTYWIGCDSCHPKPFKKKTGSTKMTMDEIFKGKWCGKCHGKVAFPANAYTNCRRCHSITKEVLRKESFR